MYKLSDQGWYGWFYLPDNQNQIYVGSRYQCGFHPSCSWAPNSSELDPVFCSVFSQIYAFCKPGNRTVASSLCICTHTSLGWSMRVFLKKSSFKTQLFITQALICCFTACTFSGSRRIIATETQHSGPSPELRAKSAEFPSQNLKIPLTFPVMCAHFSSKTVLEASLGNHSHQERSEFLRKEIEC